MSIKYTSLEDAFYKNCPTHRLANECWEWLGVTVGGYGSVHFRSHKFSAHRLSYELHNGPIPTGMHVCHTCDNRRCVNPNHLWLGTNKDNMDDKIAKGRQARVQGHRQPNSKLRPFDVMEIRRLVYQGVSQQDIARRFGISQSNVSRISSGQAWPHLPFRR